MFYYVVRATCWIIFKIFWKIDVVGIENVPKEGGLILASNHVSYLDPIVLAITMKRKICFITKKEAFNKTNEFKEKRKQEKTVKEITRILKSN